MERLSMYQIKSRVDKCVALEHNIAMLNAHLKAAKTELVAEARWREDEQKDIPDGGAYVEFEGFNGCVAHVVFPKPSLKATIDKDSPVYTKIMALLSEEDFNAMFSPAPKYSLVQDFRAVAELTFDKTTARKLVKLCSTCSSPRVSFETKEKKEGAV